MAIDLNGKVTHETGVSRFEDASAQQTETTNANIENRLLTEFIEAPRDVQQAILDATTNLRRDAYLGSLVRSMSNVFQADPAEIAKVRAELADLSAQPWHAPGGPGWGLRRDIYDAWAHGVSYEGSGYSAYSSVSSATATELAQANADVTRVGKIKSQASDLGIPYRDPWSHTVRD